MLHFFDQRSKCFYDNIVFAPFIFVEDPLEPSSQGGAEGRNASGVSLSSMSPQGSPFASASSSTLLGKPRKVDPYLLISKVGAVYTCETGPSDLFPAEHARPFTGKRRGTCSC